MKVISVLGAVVGLAILPNGVLARDWPIEVKFYKDQCYGNVLYTAKAGNGNTACLSYPRDAHFIQTSDGCPRGYCMVMQYFRGGSCGDPHSRTRVNVGSGCYNVNVGFTPVSFRASCLVC